MVSISVETLQQVFLVLGMLLTSFVLGIALSYTLVLRGRRREKLEETVDLLLEQVVILTDLREKRRKRRRNKRGLGGLDSLLETLIKQPCNNPHCPFHGAWMYEPDPDGLEVPPYIRIRWRQQQRPG